MSNQPPLPSSPPDSPDPGPAAPPVFAPYNPPAGGWGALRATAKALREQSIELKGSRALLSMNRKRCYYPTPSNFSFFSGGRFVVWRAGGLRPDRWHNACEAQRQQAQSYHRRLPLSYPFRPLEHRA